MKAAAFFEQTTGQLLDTLQRWSGAIDDEGGVAEAAIAADMDEFIIDVADTGILRFPAGSAWETTSDALLRLGGAQVLPAARLKVIEMLDALLNDARPLAFLASWFHE